MDLGLDKLPVATLLIVVVAVVGGIDLILDGDLSEDFESYGRSVAIGAGLLGIGRGLNAGTPRP